MAHLLDGWAAGFRLPDVYEKDWGRLLRVMGFAPTWLLIAIAISLQESAGRRPDPSTRSTWRVMVIAMIVGGLGSEVLKLLIRRERPGDSGDYQFRSFAEDPFSTRGLGMPSGHTMVAFTGAAAIGRRFPRAAPILYGLAVGCGATRILAHAHFLSDVTAAAIGGTLAGRWAARPVEPKGQPT
ncbi:MAG: phosphatase PAP2 family protein [Gemmatimonadales bacterium]